MRWTGRTIGRGGLGLVLVAVVTLLATTSGQAISKQAGPSQGSSPTTAATGIRLVSQSGFVAPTGLFRVQLSVPPMPAGSTVRARVYARTSISNLDDTAQGKSLGSKQAPDVTVPLTETTTSDGTQGVVDLGYQLADGGADPPLGFALSQPGVYPFTLEILDAKGASQGRLITHIVRLPDVDDGTADPVPLTVAFVVPLSAPVAHQPDGSIDLDDDQANALRSIIQTLNRYPSVPASLTPTPETVAALAATDRSSTEPITPALRSAASGGRQVISGPFVTVPASSWLERGLADRYDQELAAGADQLRATLGAAPDQTTAALDATTSAAVLSQLVTNGATQAVVPRDRLAPTSKGEQASTLTQTFDLVGANGEQVRAVATDTDLSDQLTATDDPVLGAHEVLAALSLIALDTNNGQPCVSANRSTSKCSRGVAIQLPADAAIAQPGLDALLNAMNDRTGTGIDPGNGITATTVVAGAAVLSAMTVSNLIGVVDAASSTSSTGPSSPPRQRQLVAPDSVPLGTYPTRLEAVAAQVGGFRSLLSSDDPVGLELARSLDLVLLSSGAVSLDDAGRLAYLDGAAATVKSQTDQITSPEQQVVTLTSGEGIIPLSISNALPYPVTVTVTFASAKLEFPDGAQLTGLVLPANTPTPIRVPVRVRASGAFPLEVTVRSPDNTLAVTSTKFTVRSTAVSGLGLVLTIVAGLFLLLWWGRHFRKTRRARRLVGSTHPVLRGNGSSDDPDGAADADGASGGSQAISYAPAETD